MTGEERRIVRVSLELDLEARPIAGVLTDGDGMETRFTGWLGLASALEDLQSSRAGAPEHAESDA